MQRKKKCTVILENGRMLEKMAGWNACLSWPTHKTASLGETCNNSFPYLLCLVCSYPAFIFKYSCFFRKL